MTRSTFHVKSPARTLFVTGTDTGVGKTTLGVAIVAALTAEGIRVAPFKPAETGCADSPDGFIAEDANRLIAATDRADLPGWAVCPFRYSLPAAPAVAAPPERPVTLERLDEAHALLRASADLILAEGAGGFLVPFTDTLLAADLAVRYQAELLIVSRASLGTINHTLLTLAEARRRQVPVLGVILNETTPPGPDAPTNAAQIAHHGNCAVFGPFPKVADTSPASLASTLRSRAPELLARIRALAI
jgi:dethiobiotin synthetase